MHLQLTDLVFFCSAGIYVRLRLTDASTFALQQNPENEKELRPVALLSRTGKESGFEPLAPTAYDRCARS